MLKRLSLAVVAVPLLGSAYWERELDYLGTAFCLYSDQTIPTVDDTWGGVKSLYK